MRKKIARWWAEKTPTEKSITILTFIMLTTIIQVLVLTIRLNEVISLLLQAIRQASL